MGTKYLLWILAGKEGNFKESSALELSLISLNSPEVLFDPNSLKCNKVCVTQLAYEIANQTEGIVYECFVDLQPSVVPKFNRIINKNFLLKKKTAQSIKIEKYFLRFILMKATKADLLPISSYSKAK